VHCEVTELEPPKTLAYTWCGMPGMNTVVRLELTETDDGTLVVCTHSGFDLTEESHLKTFRSMSGGWAAGRWSPRWDRVLTELAVLNRGVTMHVSIVSIPVSDSGPGQEVLHGRTGFQQLSDAVMQPDMPWVHLAAPDGGATITLVHLVPHHAGRLNQGLGPGDRGRDSGTPTCQLRTSRSPNGIQTEPWGRYLTVKDPDGNGIVLQTSNRPSS